MTIETHSFWVLVTRSPEVRGQWLAHCLSLDLSANGATVDEALTNTRDLITVCVRDDLEADMDPLARDPAPEECWEPLWEIMKRGVPFNSLPPETRRHVSAVAARIQINWKEVEITRQIEPADWRLSLSQTDSSVHG